MSIRYGAIEGGGTTFLVAIAEGHPENVIIEKEFRTTTPQAVLELCRQFFVENKVDTIGFGSFGPIDLRRGSPTYGYITSTPKTLWQNTDVLGPFKSLGVPLGFDTDVNAAALAEMEYGGHGKINSCVYITFGTGVGAGVVVHGKPVHGILHPEAGHFRIPRHPDDDYKGNCIFHQDCVEGLCNSAALAARSKWDRLQLKNLPDSNPAWDMQAFYVAHLCLTLTTILSPEVIVLGGGVMKNRQFLLKKIQDQFKLVLNNYLLDPKYSTDIDKYIVTSRFNARGSKTSAGVVGTLELGRRALLESKQSKL